MLNDCRFFFFLHAYSGLFFFAVAFHGSQHKWTESRNDRASPSNAPACFRWHQPRQKKVYSCFCAGSINPGWSQKGKQIVCLIWGALCSSQRAPREQPEPGGDQGPALIDGGRGLWGLIPKAACKLRVRWVSLGVTLQTASATMLTTTCLTLHPVGNHAVQR